MLCFKYVSNQSLIVESTNLAALFAKAIGTQSEFSWYLLKKSIFARLGFCLYINLKYRFHLAEAFLAKSIALIIA